MYARKVIPDKERTPNQAKTLNAVQFCHRLYGDDGKCRYKERNMYQNEPKPSDCLLMSICEQSNLCPFLSERRWTVSQ